MHMLFDLYSIVAVFSLRKWSQA